MKSLLAVVVLSTGLVLVTGSGLSAQQLPSPGTLDTSFGNDGKVTTAIGTGDRDEAWAVAVQADGKIVAAGRSDNGRNHDFAVVRYNADGSLDTGFGSDGKVTTAIRSDDRAWAVAVQADGKIVAAGRSTDRSNNGVFALVRYNADGSLDTGFDADGKVTTAVGSSGLEQAWAVAVQPDGKIVAAGYNFNGRNTDFALVRYNADGSLDTSFGSDGKVTTAVGASYDVAFSVAVQSDGKIVAAGRAGWDFALVRYNADGSLDTSFDADGKVITAVGSGRDEAFSVAVQSDGKIVAAGRAGWDFALVRYNADGSLDTSFDADGKVITAVGSREDMAFSVAVQSDGKIVAAGHSDNGRNHDFALVRYNADGSLDTSFDADGKVTTAIGASIDQARATAVQSDGKIVAAGYSYNGRNNDFAVVRYNADGSLDTGFGADGKVTTAVGASEDRAWAVAVQSDGKIVAAGYSEDGRHDAAGYSDNRRDNDFALVRYNADGSLDTGFGSDGRVTTAVGRGTDRGRSVAVQPDGKIVVAGYSDNGSDFDFAVVRYNADGSLDTRFDADGKVTTAVGSGEDRAFSVAVQSDGKIVAAGYSDNGSDFDFAVVRYNADGSLDTGFDADGKVTTAVGSGEDRAFSVAVQPVGKIVAAGYSDNGSDFDFALVSYNADGSFDTAFGSDGKVTAAIGSRRNEAYSVAVQPDGKIVAAGYSSTGPDRDFAVARWHGTAPPVPPRIADVGFSSAPAGGAYVDGEEVMVGVVFDRPVVVDVSGGVPFLELVVGSRVRRAAFRSVGASGAGVVLEFGYAVSGDVDHDGMSIAADSVRLNGGVIRHPEGWDADLGHDAVATQPLQMVSGVAAPRGVSASATDWSVSVSWVVPAQPAGVSLDELFLERLGEGDEVVWSAGVADDWDVGEESSWSYSVWYLEAGTRYRFRVRLATMGHGDLYSDTVVVSTQSEPLAAPEGLTASVGEDGQVRLSWTIPDQPGWLDGVDGVWVERRDTTAFDRVGEAVWQRGTTSYDAVDVTAMRGLPYEYRVRMYATGRTLPSDVVEVTVPAQVKSGPGPLAGFSLIDATDQSLIAALADGATVLLANPSGGDFTVRADIADGQRVGSVRVGSVHFELSGPVSTTRTESWLPYALYGDGGSHDLYGGGPLPPGEYTLTATAYSIRYRRGDTLGTLTITFNIGQATSDKSKEVPG